MLVAYDGCTRGAVYQHLVVVSLVCLRLTCVVCPTTGRYVLLQPCGMFSGPQVMNADSLLIESAFNAARSARGDR